jgi:uroporphyrinogen-III synthase
MANYKILSTKKLSSSLLKQAKENNIEVIEMEFISIRKLFSEEEINEMQNRVVNHYFPLVFTSANAVESIQNYLSTISANQKSNFKIFCLSGRTKNALLPFFPDERIITTADNALLLAKKIADEHIKEVVFFCGKSRRDELPFFLKKNGINVQEVIVYETIETPTHLSEVFDGILFFSPSAVTSFFSVNQLKDNTVCFAIGETTAEMITHYTDNKIIRSDVPSQEMILNLVNSYFQHINCQDE